MMGFCNGDNGTVPWQHQKHLEDRQSKKRECESLELLMLANLEHHMLSTYLAPDPINLVHPMQQ